MHARSHDASGNYLSTLSAARKGNAHTAHECVLQQPHIPLFLCHSGLHQPLGALPYGLLQGVTLPQLNNPGMDIAPQGFLILQDIPRTIRPPFDIIGKNLSLKNWQ